MTKGRPKREKPQGNDQITSEDLFGDMIDEPLARPEPAAPARRPGPVRIQVAEPGQGTKETSRGPRDLIPEEVAALLDAFSGPAEDKKEDEKEEAAQAQVVSPVPTPKPKLKPKTEPAIPIAELIAKVAPRAVIPAQPEPAPPPPVTASPATGPVPLFDPSGIEPFNDTEEELRDLNLDELTPAPPWRGAVTARPAAIPDLKRGPAAPDRPPPVAPVADRGNETDRGRLDSGAVEERVALDLAALAEDALAEPEAEPSAPVPLSKEQSYGPYRLIEKLAVGGMAEVFKASRSGVEGFYKVVAVKRILAHLSDNQEFVEMFINEAKMVAGLTHPNIVQTYDLGKIDPTYYIAMEYVHGRDLRTIMRRAKERGIRIPFDISAYIVTRVCSALDYAHRKKDDQGRPMRIVHRDVSPQNIMISFEGDVKLTDFGIAKAASKATHTERGALRGKLLYMSPEQALGKPMDGRSDVFSLGIVFYEMITEAKPFLASSETSILEAVRECRLTAPTVLNPRIPQRLERVVLKALEKDPEERYQDASDLARDLELALGQRKPPTATELARFMEIMFDPEERGVTARPASGPAEDEGVERKALEMEFDQTPRPGRSTAAAQSPTPQTKDMSIDKLLKRFGIR